MIVAAMATMPERSPYLEHVVETIRPQVDLLKVYLNNFVKRPPFLEPDEVCFSDAAAGDLGDAGKFYWVDGRDGVNGYTHYATIDDDLAYPSDYIATLVKESNARNGKAIIGVHCSIFSDPVVDYSLSRQERHTFYEPLSSAKPVNMLGTGTALLGRKTLALSLENDFLAIRNAADLQLAIAAQKQEVPMVAIARPKKWITEIRPWNEESFSIWQDILRNGWQAETALARTAISTWRVHADPISL